MGKKSTTPFPVDPALDVPAEANREKHVNFIANEAGEIRRVGNDEPENKDESGTHAPGSRHLPENPRNLPTENTSMSANTETLGNP